jgi:hypothetical protein
VTVGRYLAALVKVDAFPVDDVIPRASYNEIIDRLKRFEIDWTAPCDRCKVIDWVRVLPHIKLSIVSND